MLVECESRSDTSNIMGNWTRLKTIQKIPKQHTGKAHQGTAENSYIVCCTYTANSANVKVHNIYNV